MKATPVIVTLAVLAAAGTGVYLYNPDLVTSLVGEVVETEKPRAVPGSYIGNNLKLASWKSPEKLSAALGKQIREGVRGASRKDISRFLENPQNRLLLAQWQLADAALRYDVPEEKDGKKQQTELEKYNGECHKAANDARRVLDGYMEAVDGSMDLASERMQHIIRKQEKLTEYLEDEANAPKTLQEALQDPATATLFNHLCHNLDWMEQLTNTGELERPGVVLSILSRIAKANPEMIYNPVEREIATATALEFARYGWQQKKAVERAQFYLDSYRAKRLHPMFENLPFWQRRVVCGCKGDNTFGSVESLRWCLENVHLPAGQYGNCCWRAGYKLHNLFTDSIHGPMYYAPFDDIYGDNKTGAVAQVGGVCGSLSHFGAFSALAHGIPALTAGEPGHCAFIVLMNGKWTPCYSLDWDRGCHWQAWRGNHTFSSLHAATELYSAENAEKTALSHAARVVAAQFAKSDLPRAARCYELAVKLQPCNYIAWRQYADSLAKHGAKDVTAWGRLNTSLCRNLAKDYPEMAAQLLQAHVYPGMSLAMADNHSALLASLMDFWKYAGPMKPDRWKVEALLNSQIKLANVPMKDTPAVCKFYGDILGLMANNKEYMPIILGWGNTLSKNRSNEEKRLFLAATLKGVSQGKKLEAEDRDVVLKPAILAAEEMRDIKTFQALAQLVSEGFRKGEGNMPRFEPFPGKLASQGGVIWTSSTSKFDKPCAHHGVLEPYGGSFHTAKDKDAFVGVMLPRQVLATGIVIVPVNGNLHRMNNLRIQVSETGKDNDWQDVGRIQKCTAQPMRIDLQDKLPRTKFVRIIREGGPEFFHLRGIYVYGNQAS